MSAKKSLKMPATRTAKRPSRDEIASKDASKGNGRLTKKRKATEDEDDDGDSLEEESAPPVQSKRGKKEAKKEEKPGKEKPLEEKPQEEEEEPEEEEEEEEKEEEENESDDDDEDYSASDDDASASDDESTTSEDDEELVPPMTAADKKPEVRKAVANIKSRFAACHNDIYGHCPDYTSSDAEWMDLLNEACTAKDMGASKPVFKRAINNIIRELRTVKQKSYSWNEHFVRRLGFCPDR